MEKIIHSALALTHLKAYILPAIFTNPITIKSFFLFLLIALLGTSSLLAQTNALTPNPDNQYFFYNGYQFNISSVRDTENLTESIKYNNVCTELEGEIDQINQVGLSPDIQDFFKTVPISIVQNYSENPTSIELLYDDVNECYLSGRISYLFDVLLESFLYYSIPQGSSNPDILKYYQQAKDLGLYTGSDTFTDWLMTDPVAFFAESAKAYLVGYSESEPFSYAELKKNQPEFYSYLQTLFGPTAGFENQSFSYHGYLINTTALLTGWTGTYFNLSPIESKQELQRQVDYIEAVGLPATITNFFKTIPIEIAPYTYMDNGQAEGSYFPNMKSILLNDDLTAYQFGDGLQNPVLLHELLHAFHDQQLPQGWNNPDILKYYQQAKELGCYNGTATGYTEENIDYLMTNAVEFFAVTGTAYLLGTNSYQAPFTRDQIQRCQPEYFQYLQQLFGPGAGTYLPYLAPSPLRWYNQLLNLWGVDMDAAY